jgi:probable F420-dependent oxidoreductase
VEFGAHLPLMDFGGHVYRLTDLEAYVRTARDLGFSTISANDHLVFSTPWLDGVTALASVIAASGDMGLMTTVALPVVRGPLPTAKALAAIDVLSGGRLTVGVSAGSSSDDHRAMGLDFDERWKRLDDAIVTMRALWDPEQPPHDGPFYSTTGIDLRPPPAQPGGPPIWIGSWGSQAGLRRTARLGDGWLASAYNTTPQAFGDAWRELQEALRDRGRDPSTFPNGLATMWFHISESRAEADRVMHERVLSAIHRPEEVLRERLPIGSAEAFAEKLAAFGAAGVQRVLVWPVTDELHQLELFSERVRPLLPAS